MTLDKPVMRFFGGKWQLAPWIISNLPPHHCYCEPFGGGGNVLLRKPRSKIEVYNDLNTETVNVFRVLRDREMAARLRDLVILTPFASGQFEEVNEPVDGYADDPDLMVEQARRTIARARMSMGNAACEGATVHKIADTNFRVSARTNFAGEWANYPQAILSFVERLHGVNVTNFPYQKIMRRLDRPGTLFYVDPPYVLATRGGDRYRHDMNDDDQRELAEFLHSIKGMVVLSGHPSPLYDELYDWETRRTVISGHGRSDREEVLWFNDAAVAAQPWLPLTGAE